MIILTQIVTPLLYEEHKRKPHRSKPCEERSLCTLSRGLWISAPFSNAIVSILKRIDGLWQFVDRLRC